VVIDVGAYNGDWSVAMSRTVGKYGLIFALEPNPEIYELLIHNVRKFPINNTRAFNCAGGDTLGLAKYNYSDSANLGMGSISLDEKGTIGITTLHFLARWQTDRKIDLIKIDAEGFDYNVLVGARALLKEDRPTIIMEINPDALKQNGASPTQIFDLLKECDYVWQRIQPEEPKEGEHYDIMAMPIIFSQPSQEASYNLSPAQTLAPSPDSETPS
jgi:FkbM family methyltransferase